MVEENKLANIQRVENDIYSNTLLSEVENRCENLGRKTNLKISELNDYQILDLKKESASFVTELNLIMERVTAFSKQTHCKETMGELCNLRNKASKDLALFQEQLDYVIDEQDLNDEKLTRAFELKINIPKFKGYGSEVDIYTFCSEFEKLVEPVVQRKLWVDYLKKNYLAGTALILVENLESIDMVWNRLIESFGNACLLLQNKISSLENIGDLGRVSGDERIVHSLALIMNIMGELSKLGREFGLEEELYYGGCLEKIITLLGHKRERTFICTTDSKCSKPEEWGRLLKFLNNELVEREKMILYEKSKKCLGLQSRSGYTGTKPTSDEPKLAYQSNTQLGNPKCFFCDGSPCAM